MSSVLSSRSPSCCRSGALASSAASASGGGAAPARRALRAAPKKQGRSPIEAISRPSFLTSASRPSPRSAAAAAAAAAAKKAPLFPSLPALPTLALPKFYSGAKLSRAKAKLLDLVSRSARGTDPAGPGRAEVEAAIDELYAAAPRSALFPLEKDPAGIDGKWKLVREKGRERGQFFFFLVSFAGGGSPAFFFFFSCARGRETTL